MALPTTRSISAVDGAALPASVINALQDAVIQGAVGEVWAKFPFQAPDTLTDASGVDGHQTQGVRLNQTTHEIHAFLTVPAGASVQEVEIYGLGDGAQSIQSDVFYYANPGAVAQNAATQSLVWSATPGATPVVSWTTTDALFPLTVARAAILTARALYTGGPPASGFASHVAVKYTVPIL